MFIDRVILEIKAGKGGNGIVAWRKEKYIPKGGPFGGNGGEGGSIYVEVDSQLASLDAFRHRPLWRAIDGGAGGANQRQGARGKALVLKVPCGTLLKDKQTGEVLFDLVKEGEKILICQGGKGGRGNASFKSPTHRAPVIATPGRPGEQRVIELELKLIADVGLVGFPNAGKSTLLTQATKVTVKRAPYPFTTLHPNLAFVHSRYGQQKALLLADIPGIIEGAHRNRGLGFAFLRHIERTKILLFMLDASGIDGRTPLNDFRVLREELNLYNPELLDKPFLVVLNKIDTEESVEHMRLFKEQLSFDPETLFEISAVTGEGVEALLERLLHLHQTIDKQGQDKEAGPEEETLFELQEDPCCESDA